MTSTTTALTVFKATLSTQSKDHTNKNNLNDEETSTPRSKENIDTIASSTCIDKDARAYEHERHRAKHAGEWAKRRARKTKIGGGGHGGGTAVGRRPAGATRGAHAGRRQQSKSLTPKGGKVELEVDDAYAVAPQDRDAEHTTADGLGAGFLMMANVSQLPVPPGEDGKTDAFKADSGVKVNLSEIMMLSQKKPHKPNADDFEVIPHIRSVIALDDVANVHDMDLDEPWEHIYANNGEEKVSDGVSKFGRLTYARVAGTGCQ